MKFLNLLANYNEKNNYENDQNNYKMSKYNLNNKPRSVTRSSQNNNNNDLSCYYKPTRVYDSTPGFKIPEIFLNKNGVFDTSKKMINLQANTWRTNRSYEPLKQNKRKINIKGNQQGDYIKYKSRDLPKLNFKKKSVECEIPTDNKFWADYSELEDNNNKLPGDYPEYFCFLKDEVQMRYYISSYDFIEESDYSDYIDKDNNNSVVLYVNKSQEKEQILEFVNTITPVVYERVRLTQGLVSLSYVADAVSAVGGAIGTYYGYRMVSDLILSVRGVANVCPSNILDVLKDYVLDIIAILVIFTRYSSGALSLGDSIALLIGYSIGKKYLSSLIDQIKKFFMMLVPAQSNIRHTQGADLTTFAQGVISLIAVFFLGSLPTEFSAKNILTSIKSLGSTLLTVKTFESVLCRMIEVLPDIIMQILCNYFPVLALYVHVSNDSSFRKFMEKVVELRQLKILDILYDSHKLNKFLELHKYFKDYILTEGNIEKGIHQLLAKDIEWFDKTYHRAEKLGLLPGKRKMPFVIWLSGPPGIGKSTLAKELSHTLVRQLLFSKDDNETVDDEDMHKYVYAHSTANKFFDGYHNQPIFILNDYLQFSSEEEEQWLIRFVDTIDVPLDVSSVDNVSQGIKGEVRFTSRIIIVTSNSTYLNTSSNIISVQAFNRRRDLLVKMDWKEQNSQISYDNFDYSWCNFHLLHPTVIGAGFDVIESFMHFESRILSNLREFTYKSDIISSRDYTSSKSKSIIQDKVNTIASVKSRIKQLLYDVGQMAFNVLEINLFKIPTTLSSNHFIQVKVKHILPMCIVGSSMYLGYQAMVGFFNNRIIQSLSGDVSTRKYAPERTPLKRHTMGMNVNILELAHMVSKNNCSITTIVNTKDGRRIQQTMWGFFVGGSLLITPKHLWKRGSNIVESGDKIVIVYRDVTYNFSFRQEDLFMDEDRDIACYNTCNKIPFSRSVEHLLLDENTRINFSGENGILVLPNKNTFVPLQVEAYIRDAPYVDEFGGRFDGKEIWQYNTKTVQGNCGAILLISFKDKVLISGMHVAGDSYTGNAEIFDTLFLKQSKNYFSRKTQGFASDAVYDDEEYFDAVSDFDDGFIFLGKAKVVPYQNTETEIRRSPFYEVLQKHITEPAVLRPSDPRLESKISPILKSVVKYGQDIRPFSYNKMDAAFRIVRSFYDDISREKLEVYSCTDAINSKYTNYLEKLDLRTSAGFPWNCQKKNKRDLIDNDNGVYTIKQELSNKINQYENLLNRKTMFPYTLTTTLKDERVSLSKVSIGKTRTFMNFPVEYTILMRRYFDSFINYETKYAREIGTTVGINIYSTMWDSIYQELKRFDYHLDGDYKAFDGTIRPEFFEYYAKLINSFYKDEFGNHRSLLVQGCCFAPIFVLDKVYVKQKGNPSGSRLTTSFNSFVNRMYVVMSMLEVLPKNYHTIDFFKTHMKLYVHGDDHLIGFSSVVKQYWDGYSLRDFMLSHGIEYTSSKKDQPLVPFNKLEECYYLKSHFVLDKVTKQVKCGLDKSVIQEMVSWQRDDDLNSTQMILNTCLRYAYFWGEDYFNDIRSKLMDHIYLRKFKLTLPYFEDLENEYEYSNQLSFSYVL